MELIKREKIASYDAVVSNFGKLFATTDKGKVNVWDSEKLHINCSFSEFKNMNNIFWSADDSLLGGFENSGKLMVINVLKNEVVFLKKIPNPTKIKHYDDGINARGFLGNEHIYFYAGDCLGVFNFVDNIIRFFKHGGRSFQNFFKIDERHYTALIFGDLDGPDFMYDVIFNDEYEPEFKLISSFQENDLKKSIKMGSDIVLYSCSLTDKNQLKIEEFNLTINSRKLILKTPHNECSTSDILSTLSSKQQKNSSNNLREAVEETLMSNGYVYLSDILYDGKSYFILFSNGLIVQDADNKDERFAQEIKYSHKLCFLPNNILLVGTWKETLFFTVKSS